MRPLVSILIPAYNAQLTIEEAIRSAIAQTWPRKEIIVIDDGSTDRTAQIASRFVPQIRLVSTENRGLSAAVNLGIQLSNGDYIQELDSDDLLAQDKVEKQLYALRAGDSKRVLLSCPWANFYFRTRHAKFVHNSLCQDLSPIEWTLRKMSENLHMQNATWLVSRELVEAAGPWDTRLHYDQDGEYFARVLAASERTRFVSETGIYYRVSGTGSISYIGNSETKKESLLLSMQLQIKYLRDLEESERVREACITYLQNWYGVFYPQRNDLAEELRWMAADLGGTLAEPHLRWKFAWMRPIFGLGTAMKAQMVLPHMKATLLRTVDKAMYRMETNQKGVQI